MAKHRIIVKCVVNYNSDYLLLKKWYDDRIEDPYQWEFPEGEVALHESPEAAAERIVEEAAGVSASAIRPLYTWQYTLGDESNIGICYLLYAPEVSVVLSEDYTESHWVSRLDFAEYIQNKKLLEDIEKAGL